MHSSATPSDKRLVSISNGIEFLLIPRSELQDAEASGYYRPESRGRTIIEREGRLFEIPLEKGPLAEQQGYRDLLLRERRSRPASLVTHVALPLIDVTSEQPSDPSGEAAPNVSDLKSVFKNNVPSPGVTAPPVSHLPIPAPTLSVVEAIEQSKREAEELRLEQERQIEEQTGLRRQGLRFQFWFAARRERLLKQLGTNSISIAIHVGILLLLASFFIASPKKQELVILSTPSTSESVVEEFTIEPETIEITEPTELEEAEASPAEEVMPETAVAEAAPNFLAAVSGEAIKPPAAPAKPAPIPGDGMASAKGKPTIFGSKFAAINYVFVIDNSNSMTKGRFETALIQLMLTVNQLTPKQRFYVIFYSDTSYGMMHPNTVRSLVPATPQNKLRLGQWLNTVPLCLRTNGKAAIQAAIDLNPDMIYVLGDGAFTDKAAQHFASNPHPRIVINTLGMEVDAKNAKEFQLLATSHRGTYRDVGVMPEGAVMAKQFPRPRNNVRGPVWGITLPPK